MAGNVTLTVKEADGVTETDVEVLGTGRQAAANSKSVAASTEDKAVLDAIAASLSVLDDWDESDRMKVNLIVGQAGITAGAGAVAANTPRVTHASDDPVVTSLQIIDDVVVTEDAAAASNPIGIPLMAVRRDTLSTSEVSADGDIVAAKATSKGKIWTAAELRIGDATIDTGAGTGGTATPRFILDDASQNQNGSTTDSGSTPVAWSTEAKAQIGSITETAPASDTASSGLNGRLQRIAQRITSLIALLPASLGAKSASGSFSVTTATDDNTLALFGAVNETAPTTDTASSGLNGRLQRIAQRLTSMLTSGLSNRAFSVTFATLTRPANTTQYAAGDSISNNATAGSVTALVSGNISDTNNDPIFINEILVVSTDTGLAGKKLRAFIFNSDPTASSGVGAGDNTAYSQKVAGYLGSFYGVMEAGFSDGSVGRLVPAFNDTNSTQAGGFIVAPPVSGARTLYIQYQYDPQNSGNWTPSANSTTIIGTARGWQGRAA